MGFTKKKEPKEKPLHSRFVEVSGVQSVREVVAVDERPVVFGEGFSCCLVFSKVPAGGQFGLQSLVATSEDKIKLLPNVTCMVKKGQER